VVILSTLYQYVAVTINSKGLNAAHHVWQRSIIGICWKDEELGNWTEQKSRVLWHVWHVLWIDHHGKRYTGIFKITTEDQEQTGEVPSCKICKRTDSPVNKHKCPLLADNNGIVVWPSASSWMCAESWSHSTESWSESQCSCVNVLCCFCRYITEVWAKFVSTCEMTILSPVQTFCCHPQHYSLGICVLLLKIWISYLTSYCCVCLTLLDGRAAEAAAWSLRRGDSVP